MSRWVTFYYDVIRNRVSALVAHRNKSDALKYFNANCGNFFELNTNFKADKLPATYGYPMRRYYGVSASTFRKMFDCSIDEALKLAEMESEKQ